MKRFPRSNGKIPALEVEGEGDGFKLTETIAIVTVCAVALSFHSSVSCLSLLCLSIFFILLSFLGDICKLTPTVSSTSRV